MAPPRCGWPSTTSRTSSCSTWAYPISTVHRDGTEVHLTPTEWGLLEVLVRNPGRLVAQQQLLHEVWGPGHTTETHYLRVYLAQLRRKLEPAPSRPQHLVTEPGMGYRFEL